MGDAIHEALAEPVTREEALDAFSRSLSRALNLSDEPPRSAVERAAADPLFLSALIGHRRDAEIVADMIASTRGRHPPKWAPPPNLTLVRGAARALAKWAAAGFGAVDNATLDRRRQACRACPHLRGPDGNLLRKVFGSGDSSICGLCSCALDRKTALPTETCPAPDPDHPGLNRWGEVLE